MRQDIIPFIEEAIKQQWNKPALTDLGGDTLYYRDLAAQVARLHLLFDSAGIKPGDKIALCGKNSSAWVTSYVATYTYGAVVVPILHEFKADSLHHLLTHSDSRLLFVDESIFRTINIDQIPNLEGVFFLKDFSLGVCRNAALQEAQEHIHTLFGKAYPEGFTAASVNYFKVTDPNSLALINYTSGSTGFSKGVMLSHKAIWSNIQAIFDILPDLPRPGDNMMCMLPMAHMYGMVIEMVHGLCKGCHLYFLTRQPSPKVLIEAFREVQPRMIITVPLIVEKIVRSKVLPSLDRTLIRLMLKTPLVRERIYAKVRQALMTFFGGKLEMMIVGGAALNREVEEFLLRIHFPITVGYGMTECAPLIGYTHANDFRPQCCGQPVPRMEVRIQSPDPERIPGEIAVRGDNVMLGYYKNPKATSAVMLPDGWMLTGDMATQDADGFLYIRGRNKTMILGPSGQNIYPEELEQKINSLPLVGESLVVDSGEGRLLALVFPDPDDVAAQALTPDQVEAQIQEAINHLNTSLEGYQRISSLKIMTEEFEKTPKRSIKRYLYNQ